MKISDIKLNNAHLDEALFKETIFNNIEARFSSFNKANFEKAKFGGVNHLKKTSFLNVNFYRTQLKGTNLSDSRLEKADLTEANFQDTLLQNTNLNHTKLAGTLFGGADVTGAEFPQEDYFKGRLTTIEESSRIARKQYSIILLGLAFSAITIASTKDAELLTNSAASPLPIIQTQIPIGGFYWVAPILLFGFFLYFHLQMQHQWQLISRLPAVFPDGTYLHQKVFPWLLNTWVINFFKHIPKEESLNRKFRNISVVILAWYSTPLILLAFWLRYLCVHDEIAIWWHMLLVLAAILFAQHFHMQSKFILSRFPMYINKRLNLQIKMGVGILFIIGFTMIFISNFVLTGNLSNYDRYFTKKILNTQLPKIPLRQLLIADFDEQEVSIKPEKWDESDPKQISLVKGAKLFRANLTYMSGFRAFLVNADLAQANLEKANLQEANLQRANLYQTNFKEANLLRANLKLADLDETNFQEAILIEANLQNSNLVTANLIGANLKNTKFKDSNIAFSLFLNVKHLKFEQIKEAKNWNLGIFNPEFIKSWDKKDFSEYINYLPKLIPDIVEFHFKDLSKEEKKQQLKTFYCLYGLSECKM